MSTSSVQSSPITTASAVSPSAHGTARRAGPGSGATLAATRPFHQIILGAHPGRARPPALAFPNALPPQPRAHVRSGEPHGGEGAELKTGRRAVGHESTSDDAPAETIAPFDPLDPTTRHAAQLGPPPTLSASPAPPSPGEAQDIAPRARVSMEELLPQLVKRIAWAGDRRRGSVQLELGAGRHAGTVVTVHAVDGRVRVELEGADVDELRSRIRARLERQGLAVDSVT